MKKYIKKYISRVLSACIDEEINAGTLPVDAYNAMRLLQEIKSEEITNKEIDLAKKILAGDETRPYVIQMLPDLINQIKKDRLEAMYDSE